MENGMINEEQRAKAIFAKARSADAGPSVYMKTRVLAELRERRQALSLRRWKFWGVASPVASAFLIAIGFLAGHSPTQAPDLTASTHRLVAVRIELSQVKNANFAEIILPEDVHFYSEKFPTLEQKQSITMAWSGGAENTKLPVVIRSDELGRKKIEIRILDQNRRVIEKRSLNIEFTDSVTNTEAFERSAV